MISKSQLLFSAFAFGLSMVCVAATALTGPVDLSSSKTDQVVFQEQDEQDKVEFPPAEDLIKDWEKPEFALFITGRLHGYIEPCGCVGLDRQKGGLLRRHTVQKLIKNRGWNVLSIDSGNQIQRFSEQALLKMETVFKSLCQTMDYDSIALGPDDLSKAPSIALAQRMVNNLGRDENGEKNPFVCANIVVLDESISERFRIFNVGGKKVGVTSLVGDEHLGIIRDDGVTKESVADGLARVIPAMKAQACDLMVCTIHAEPSTCVDLAKQYPEFDLMVTAGGAGDPKNLPERIVAGDHVTQLIYTGTKGMHVGIVGFYGDRTNLKYERVPLDARFEDSEDIKGAFLGYQDALEKAYKSGSLDDIRPRPHPTGHRFVGSDACKNCHEEEYDIWKEESGGPHTQATVDLQFNPNNDRMWVKRDYDPECLSCHVTGWDPQGYFPYESGFLNHTNDLHLTASGCENCHGPSSEHVRLQDLVKAGKLDKKDPTVVKSSKEIHLSELTARAMCMRCHDVDNSPDFLPDRAFEEYWEKIEH
jgi:hypothetical protein